MPETNDVQALIEAAKDRDAGYVGIVTGLHWNTVAAALAELVRERDALRERMAAPLPEETERAILSLRMLAVTLFLHSDMNGTEIVALIERQARRIAELENALETYINAVDSQMPRIAELESDHAALRADFERASKLAWIYVRLADVEWLAAARARWIKQSPPATSTDEADNPTENLT